MEEGGRRGRWRRGVRQVEGCKAGGGEEGEEKV